MEVERGYPQSMSNVKPALVPVLLVEDDEALLAWLSQSLMDDGWLVFTARSRPEALKIMEQHIHTNQALLAILDMGLPPKPSQAVEGLALLAALVRGWPLLKALVLTGQNDASVGQQAVRLGAFDFLAKPVGMAALKQALLRGVWFAQRELELLGQGQLHITWTAELGEGLKEASDGVAEQVVRHVLSANGFNVTAAAKTLGIAREQLYYHIKKYGIQRPDAPADPVQ